MLTEEELRIIEEDANTMQFEEECKNEEEGEEE